MKKLFMMAIGFVALTAIVFSPMTDTFARKGGTNPPRDRGVEILSPQVDAVKATAKIKEEGDPANWDCGPTDVFDYLDLDPDVPNDNKLYAGGAGFPISADVEAGGPRSSTVTVYVVTAANAAALSDGATIAAVLTDISRAPSLGTDTITITDEGWIDCLEAIEGISGPISGELPDGQYVIVVDSAKNVAIQPNDNVGPDGIYNPDHDAISPIFEVINSTVLPLP